MISSRSIIVSSSGHRVFFFPPAAQLYREANLMASIPPHPNVVRFFGCVLQRPNYALVMEFCGIQALREGGDPVHSLQQLLAEPRAELPWPERLSLATGVAAGMAHLHGEKLWSKVTLLLRYLIHWVSPAQAGVRCTAGVRLLRRLTRPPALPSTPAGARVGPNGRPVVHADLKSANVLLAQASGFSRFRFVPKIADFGLSRLRGQATTTSVGLAGADGAGGGGSAGTRAWMAPEQFRGGRATEASGAVMT